MIEGIYYFQTCWNIAKKIFLSIKNMESLGYKKYTSSNLKFSTCILGIEKRFYTIILVPN